MDALVMIAEAGLAALWLAAALALLQLVLAFAPSPEGGGTAPVRSSPIVEGALALFAMAMLMWVFARTDLSVLLVAAKRELIENLGIVGEHALR